MEQKNRNQVAKFMNAINKNSVHTDKRKTKKEKQKSKITKNNYQNYYKIDLT